MNIAWDAVACRESTGLPLALTLIVITSANRETGHLDLERIWGTPKHQPHGLGFPFGCRLKCTAYAKRECLMGRRMLGGRSSGITPGKP